jgi:hypothetical protein
VSEPPLGEHTGIERLRAAAEVSDTGLTRRRILAVGWATVDLDRSIAMATAADGSEWVPGARDALLGARSARRITPAVEAAGGAAVEVLLLEPDTEGLVAASLARFGEGLAVAWFEPDPAGDRGRRGAAGATPLGPGRLVLGGPRWGPHAVVLDGTSARSDGTQS